MTASEKTADGPALPNTSITMTSCCAFSGAGKANTSDMSAAGSASARGPEKWSDMNEVLLGAVRARADFGFFCAMDKCTPDCRHLSFDGSETCRHHQTVALLNQEAGFVAEFQVVVPFRIRPH